MHSFLSGYPVPEYKVVSKGYKYA